MNEKAAWGAAEALLKQALEETRLAQARSRLRLAKIEAAKALAEAGQAEESEALLAEVRAEQEALS